MFTRDVASLMVDRKVGMATTLTRSYPEASTTATSVHLVLAVASAVAGRRELQFEADAVNTGMNTPYETTLPVPERLLGSTARLWVAPRAPLSRQMCPWQFDVTVEARRTLALPGPEDTVVMEGVLQNADSSPVADYEARVVLSGRLASNLARTDAAGKFVLRVQRSLAAQAPGPLVVELAPADGGQPRPSLLVEVRGGTAQPRDPATARVSGGGAGDHPGVRGADVPGRWPAPPCRCRPRCRAGSAAWRATSARRRPGRTAGRRCHCCRRPQVAPAR